MYNFFYNFFNKPLGYGLFNRDNDKGKSIPANAWVDENGEPWVDENGQYWTTD